MGIVWILAFILTGRTVQATTDGAVRRFTRIEFRAALGLEGGGVKKSTWDNTLTVLPDLIMLELYDGTTYRIPPARVTAVNYGRQEHKRRGLIWFSLSVPGALLHDYARGTAHFIGIEAEGEDGQPTGLLIRADKGDVADVIEALTRVTSEHLA